MPDDREQYAAFYDELIDAKSVPVKRFEDTQWFEACLPLEELARRGVDTLRFGPMKPKGLPDPKTGFEPYACVQLRQENLMADAYGLVGFQNHLKYGEQARVLRLIPGLENADILQYGQIHRNTFINSPKILNENLSHAKRSPAVFRRPDHWCRGLRRIGRDRLAGWNKRRTCFARSADIDCSGDIRDRCALPIRFKCRDQKFSAGEYHLRPAGTAAGRAA